MWNPWKVLYYSADVFDAPIEITAINKVRDEAEGMKKFLIVNGQSLDSPSFWSLFLFENRFFLSWLIMLVDIYVQRKRSLGLAGYDY